MGLRCSEKVDLFSYGVILWELITGEPPARGRLRNLRRPLTLTNSHIVVAHPRSCPARGFKGL